MNVNGILISHRSGWHLLGGNSSFMFNSEFCWRGLAKHYKWQFCGSLVPFKLISVYGLTQDILLFLSTQKNSFVVWFPVSWMLYSWMNLIRLKPVYQGMYLGQGEYTSVYHGEIMIDLLYIFCSCTACFNTCIISPEMSNFQESNFEIL